MTVRRVTRTMRSTAGISRTSPGPFSSITRPSRNTTARSYSRSTRTEAAASASRRDHQDRQHDQGRGHHQDSSHSSARRTASVSPLTRSTTTVSPGVRRSSLSGQLGRARQSAPSTNTCPSPFCQRRTTPQRPESASRPDERAQPPRRERLARGEREPQPARGERAEHDAHDHGRAAAGARERERRAGRERDAAGRSQHAAGHVCLSHQEGDSDDHQSHAISTISLPLMVVLPARRREIWRLIATVPPACARPWKRRHPARSHPLLRRRGRGRGGARRRGLRPERRRLRRRRSRRCRRSSRARASR